jgi:hypothetical protein
MLPAMRTLAALAAVACSLAATAPTATAAKTEVYVFGGRVVTIDVNRAILTLEVTSANRAARRFLGRHVRFRIALAEVEVLDRTGDGAGLPEDVQASDIVRVNAKANRRSKQPFEATRVVDLSAPPQH